MELNNKIILIVGGAAGIGRASVELCKDRGATVIAADIDEAAGKALAGECGVTFLPVDVTSESSVRRLFSTIEELYGRLDVLLHTAGILQGAFVTLDDFALETFRRVLEVNTTGSFLCAKYAAPLLRKAGKGVIILVSSGAATGGSSSFAYGTSKGGVNSLGIVLANALAADNIRVNVVSPGNIDTAMKRSVIAADVERKGNPAEFDQALRDSNLGDPIGVARILAWLASDEADYVRGGISTR
ncbi:MAG: SDR family oxidoreductase [Anaerolineaceae bacterium]|nr:SDR family oxidoreductase [Anaerolineaceae bacterium]